jgi:hypothetical protein
MSQLTDELVRITFQMLKSGELSASDDVVKARLATMFKVVTDPAYKASTLGETSQGWGSVVNQSQSSSMDSDWWGNGWGSRTPPREN